ncbi:MAG: glycosyltransferase family 2 protein [Desulfobacterales bacterium]|nr:glycosyltransferase family 2 protein [Desulfobacterales bacterium]
MNVSVVTVNYKTPLLTEALVRQLSKISLISRIIVVDNSADLSPELFEGLPKPILVRSRENIGYGRAVNHGIAHVETEWVLVINPDVRLDEASLARLLEAAASYGAPLAGPRFYWDDSHTFRLPPATGMSLWHSIGARTAQSYMPDAHLFSFYWQIRHDRFWQASEPFYEPFLSGACLLINMDRIFPSGGRLFDERFFMYYEDTDLCLQTLLGGQTPICVPGAEVVHYYNQAPAAESHKQAMMQASESQFFQKYYEALPDLHLGRQEPLVDCEDLGTIEAPPALAYSGNPAGGRRRGGLFFEMAFNPFFCPFAQAVVENDGFAVPAHIWEQLPSSATYFARFRKFQGPAGKIWKWIKR